jgi:pyrroline-5-carboxylate reductase
MADNIGFIGSGMMAEAIIGGMLRGGFAPSEIRVSDIQASRRQYIEEQYGVAAAADNRELAKACGVLVLAVKPQYYPNVAPDLQEVLRPDHRIISIMAGVTISRLEKDLCAHSGDCLSVIRVMPNTPALVGAGVTAICAGSRVKPEDAALAKRIFSAVGTAVETEEHLINAFSGVASCGPAYVYMMIEALADGGVMMGLPRGLALQLAAEMVRGSAQMVISGAGHPEELKDKVCSPGGTTIEGVYALEKAGFRGALMEAVRVSTEKYSRL